MKSSVLVLGNSTYVSVADPGFSIGGRLHPLGGGAWTSNAVLFGENVCENERIGSHGGLGPPQIRQCV